MRELSEEEADKFNQIWDKYRDWSLVHECIAHVKPFLKPEISVLSVSDTPIADKRPEIKAKNTKWAFDTIKPRQEVGISIKLTDGSVVSLTLETAYFVKSVMTLAGWEQTEPKADVAKWAVYVVRCKDGSLYCGTTTDVVRRVAEHNTSPRGAKYTRSRRPVTLVQSWPMRNRSEAVKAELRFKALSKAEKESALRPKGAKS